MDSSKPWYASKAVWGGLIAVLSPLVGALLHINLNTDASQISDALAAFGSGVGGLIAVYGRVKADSTIGGAQ